MLWVEGLVVIVRARVLSDGLKFATVLAWPNLTSDETVGWILMNWPTFSDVRNQDKQRNFIEVISCLVIVKSRIRRARRIRCRSHRARCTLSRSLNGTSMSLALLQRCARCYTPISSIISRSFINHAAQRTPPNPTGMNFRARGGPLLTTWTAKVPDAKSFLSAIGRSTEKKVKVEEWTDLWKLNGQNLKEQGVAVRDRRCALEIIEILPVRIQFRAPAFRYILWAMERFRQGESPLQYAHEMKPKKKIRG